MKPSRDADYFAKIYAQNPDPWNFTSSDYERRKYDATIGMLGTRMFSAGLEAGCSIGVLTQRLAARCEHLLALDIVPAVLDEARARCAGLDHVAFGCRKLPADWPAQNFDLMVFSEMLYFLSADDIRQTADLACRHSLRNGAILLVNYTVPIDEPCNGDAAAELFIAACGTRATRLGHHTAETFRIDLLRVD